MTKNILNDFSQVWLFERYLERPDFYYKKMFGGLACYLQGKMVLCLMEDPVQNFYKDKKFDYPIWNGLLLPTERHFHQSLKAEWPALTEHPVLGKWLYLPMQGEEYESVAPELIKAIFQKDERFGIIPKPKKKAKKILKKTVKKKSRVLTKTSAKPTKVRSTKRKRL